MRAWATTILLVTVFFPVRRARAEDHGMFPIEEVARSLIGEETPVKGVFVAFGAGWEPKDRAALEGEIGWSWGTYDSGLFPTTSVFHVTLAPRLRTGLGQSGTDVDAALLFGYTSESLGTAGIAGGVDVRLADDLAVGPLIKARAGFGFLTVYSMLGVVFDSDPSVVFGLGLELIRTPPGPAD